MTWKRIIWALIAGAVMLVTSFIITNMAYLAWADWRYPGTSSMAGMSSVVLALIVAPVCALVTTGVLIALPDKKAN